MTIRSRASDSSSHERLEPSDSLLCDGQLDRVVRPRPRRGRPEGQELAEYSVLDLQLTCGEPASRESSGLHPPRDRRGPDARSLSRLRRVHDHYLPLALRTRTPLRDCLHRISADALRHQRPGRRGFGPRFLPNLLAGVV